MAVVSFPLIFLPFFSPSEKKVSYKNEINELAHAILKKNDLKIPCEKVLTNLQPIQIVSLLQKSVDDFDTEELRKNLKELDPSFNSFLEDVSTKVSPSLKTAHSQTKTRESWENSFPFRFIRNFVETFTSSFNLFDSHEPPARIYEKHVLLQIYFRMFQIPFALGLLLKPLFTTVWKVYLATTLVFSAGVSAIYLCNRYLKPFPDQMSFCEKIDQIVASEYPNGFSLGINHEMAQLLENLNAPKSIPTLIEGVTRIGKSSLALQLHFMIKEKNENLPQSLKDEKKPAKVVLINAEKLVADTKTPFGDKISTIERELNAIKDKYRVIVFVDEVQAAAQSESSFGVMKQFLRLSGVDIIAMTTCRERESKLKAMDVANAFESPFNLISFTEWNPFQVKAHLIEIANREGKDVPFDSIAIQTAMDLTRNSSNSAWHHEASKLLRSAINRVRNNLERYTPVNFAEKQWELQSLNFSEVQRANELNKELNDLKIQHEEIKQQLNFLRKMQNLWRACEDQLIAIHQLASQDGKNSTLEKPYLYFSICSTILKKFLDAELKAIEKLTGKSLKVDGDLIRRIYYTLSKEEQAALKKIIDAWKKKENHLQNFETPAYRALLEHEWRGVSCKEGLFKDYNKFKEAFECLLCEKL